MIESGPSSVLIPAMPLLGDRSDKWPKLERKWKERHPECAVCNTTAGQIDVHHVVPFHADPSKELDESNLMTLCRLHHFLFGHLMDWASWNDRVRVDAPLWHEKIVHRPHLTKES